MVKWWSLLGNVMLLKEGMSRGPTCIPRWGESAGTKRQARVLQPEGNFVEHKTACNLPFRALLLQGQGWLRSAGSGRA